MKSEEGGECGLNAVPLNGVCLFERLSQGGQASECDMAIVRSAEDPLHLDDRRFDDCEGLRLAAPSEQL